MSDNKKIEDLEKRLSVLEKSISEKGKPAKEKKPRKPTAYNDFMKKEIAKIKKENEGITHKDAWGQATKAWKDQKNDKKE